MRIENIYTPKQTFKGMETKKPYLKPIPYDSAEFTKTVLKTSFLFQAGSLIGKAAENISTSMEINKAIKNSEFFKHVYKDAKEKILEGAKDCKPEDIIAKIKFLDTYPISKYGPTMWVSAINSVVLNNNINPRETRNLFELIKNEQDRDFIALESYRDIDVANDFFKGAHATIMYNDFENLSSRDKYEFLEYYLKVFKNIDAKTFMEYGLSNVGLFSDIIEAGSMENLSAELKNRMTTGGVTTLEKSDSKVKDALDTKGILSYEALKTCLGETNLEKYKFGVPLSYQRKDFIQDFKNELKNLYAEEQKAIYKHFKFNIDKNSDIINCPVPNPKKLEGLTPNGQKALENCEKLVNRFLFENSVNTPDNKNFENTMNTIIGAFPELITIIGKEDHKGESLDYHTLKVLQIALQNPETKNLTEEEQRILIFSVLFHDFSKKEGEVDKRHPKESAKYADEIFKKTNLTNLEKERIHTQIKHSHWLGDINNGKHSIEDTATFFRNPNDFKIAKIIGHADINSSELTIGLFGNALKAAPYKKIEDKIGEIHKNSPMIFNTKFPSDKSKFQKDENGVMILDFTNPDIDLEALGFEKGTTPKTLKTYIHRPETKASPEKMMSLCDNKQDVVLSTMLLNNADNFMAYSWNSSPFALLLDCSNADVILGGWSVSGTGGKRGFDYVKNVFFNHEMKENFIDVLSKERKQVPNKIKELLLLNDEEYTTLFENVANFDSLEKVPDKIKVSDERTISKEEFKSAMEELYRKLFDPINKETGNGYQNEFCIYKPKIQAFALKKENYEKPDAIRDSSKEIVKSVIQTAKEKDIPIVLI